MDVLYTRLLHGLHSATDPDLLADVAAVVRPGDFSRRVRPQHEHATYDELLWSFVIEHASDLVWNEALYWPLSDEAAERRQTLEPALKQTDVWQNTQALWGQRMGQIMMGDPLHGTGAVSVDLDETRCSVLDLAEEVRALGNQGRAVHRARHAVRTAEQAQALGVAGDADAVDEAMASLKSARERIEVGLHRQEDEDWRAMIARLADPDKPSRIAVPTGWRHVDASLRGGWGIGEFAVIAAGTSVGKSLITGAIARNVIWPNAAEFVPEDPSTDVLSDRLLTMAGDVRLLIIATESPAESYVQRWQLDLLHATSADLDDTSRRAVLFAKGNGDGDGLIDKMMAPLLSSDCRVKIIDRTKLRRRYRGNGRELASVCAAIRSWVSTQRRGAKEHGEPEPRLCVVIDYLQRIKLIDEAVKRLRSRMEQLAEISETLDDLAESERIAIVCTAMTNGRIGHATADDATIREAADVEQACDVLVHVDTLGQDKAQALRRINAQDFGTIDTVNLGIAEETMKLIYRKGRATGCAQASLLLVDYGYQRISMLAPKTQEYVATAPLNDDPLTWARNELKKHTKKYAK